MAYRENPLRVQSSKRVTRGARDFHTQHKLGRLVEQDVFVRGALAARNDYADSTGFALGTTEIEKECLKRANTSPTLEQMKQLSKENWLILCTCVFAAITQFVFFAFLGRIRERGINGIKDFGHIHFLPY